MTCEFVDRRSNELQEHAVYDSCRDNWIGCHCLARGGNPLGNGIQLAMIYAPKRDSGEDTCQGQLEDSVMTDVRKCECTVAMLNIVKLCSA